MEARVPERFGGDQPHTVTPLRRSERMFCCDGNTPSILLDTLI